MFPELSDKQLLDALKVNNYDLQLSADFLLRLEERGEAQKSPQFQRKNE